MDDYAKYHCFGFNPERAGRSEGPQKSQGGGPDWNDCPYDNTFNDERKYRMKKINNAPAFGLGEVIDLSYRHGGMPNRIRIEGVFYRDQDTMWMYDVLMENTGDRSVMNEKFISERKSSKVIASSGVYSNPEIQRRFKEGWRWCGNFAVDTARANAKLIADNSNIKNVRLWPAIDSRNRYVSGSLGIWIKYVNVIYDDGDTGYNGPNDCEDIK